jgi:DNA-binding CsgD family transcriptional regulator
MSPAELPQLIRLKYATQFARWTALIARRPPVAFLRADGGDQGGAATAWRDMLGANQIHDVASVAFADEFGCWGFLDLWRAGSTAFDEASRAFLGDIAEDVTRALRSSQAATFAAPAVDVPRELGPMVLLLDNELNVVERTASTERWTRLLVPVLEDRPSIPAAAYNVGAQLLAAEDGIDDHPASARVHLDAGLWVTLRAARTSARRVAVTIEETGPDDRLDIFSRSHGLSPRETELLGHLATGADTVDVAERMFVSENTVQDHLKSIFGKTALRNRRSLLSRATGARTH